MVQEYINNVRGKQDIHTLRTECQYINVDQMLLLLQTTGSTSME